MDEKIDNKGNDTSVITTIKSVTEYTHTHIHP